MQKYANVGVSRSNSFRVTAHGRVVRGHKLRGYGTQRTAASRYKSEKLLNPTNQVDIFHIVKADFSRIVAFLGAIFKN
jgi:hypothetical protein